MQYRVILDGAITIQHYADMSGCLYGMSVVRILTNPIKRLEANHPTDIKMDEIQTKSWHYSDVIMGMIASQITSLTIAYSTVYSDADQRKHQSSAALAFVRGIHRGPVNSPHKWPVTRKMFPFDDVIMGKGENFALRGYQYHWDIKNRGVYKVSKTTWQLTKHGYNALFDIWNPQRVRTLTRWGRGTHICTSKLIIIGSENGRRHAIFWINAEI